MSTFHNIVLSIGLVALFGALAGVARADDGDKLCRVKVRMPNATESSEASSDGTSQPQFQIQLATGELRANHDNREENFKIQIVTTDANNAENVDNEPN